MSCIICNAEEPNAPIEHIVPESLGNQSYVLGKGNLCSRHNNMFSEFESKALTKTVLGMERARSGIRTKKGKPPASKTGSIQFTGDDNFRRNFIRVSGLKEEDIKDFDPVKKTFKVLVQGFDKTEAATSKLMLKIGLESLSKSQKEIYAKYNLDDARAYLDNRTNNDWPFLTTHAKIDTFKSIPRFTDKHELKKIRCELLVSEVNEKVLLFNFIYCGVSIIINLINRDVAWVKPYLASGSSTELYPIHMRKKVQD